MRRLLALLVVSVVLGPWDSARADATWPMFQRTASHTGYFPVALDPSRFVLRWQRKLGTLDLNPVTAVDGRVFVSEVGYFSDAGLYVLDAATAETQWSIRYGSVFSVNPPSYAYGNVYIQTGNHATDTYLRAYRADTGELVFQSAHAAQWERYYAPTIADGVVFVNGGYYGGMYAFDAFTGQQLWYLALPQYDQWTPAVDDSLAYSYVGEYAPGLYAADRVTGALMFTIPDPDFVWDGWSMNLAPVLGGAGDAVVIHDGRLISFDLVSRAIRWQLDGNFAGQPAVAKGVIYAINSGALNARDQLTGQLLWAWGLPTASLQGTIIATDSHLLVRTSSATYAVDVATHQEAWSYPASGHLSLAEGTLYIAGAGGALTAIGLDVSDTVTILRAIFLSALSTLFVSATSSASPDVALFVTVPDCLTDAPMRWKGHAYVLLNSVRSCGSLDGQTATVTSSDGGMATATIR